MTNVVNLFRTNKPVQTKLRSESFPVEWVVSGYYLATFVSRDEWLAAQLLDLVSRALHAKDTRVTIESPLLERAEGVIDVSDPECRKARVEFEINYR